MFFIFKPSLYAAWMFNFLTPIATYHVVVVVIMFVYIASFSKNQNIDFTARPDKAKHKPAGRH